MSLGGIGCMRRTPLGAGTDVLIALEAFSEPEFHDYLNRAIEGLGDFDESAAVRRFTRALTEPRCDVFAKGRRFLREEQDTVRLRASQRAIRKLQSKQISIGIMEYARTPERLVSSTVQQSPEFAQYVTGKGELIRQIQRGKTSGPIKDHISSKFSTFKEIRISRGAPISEVYPVSPVAGLDAHSDKIIQCFGISTHDVLKTVIVLLEELRRDPGFPRDLTSEAVARVITEPAIMRDISICVDVLIAMGASMEAATKVAVKIKEVKDQFSLASEFIFSLRDGFTQYLDLAPSNFNRCTQVDPTGYREIDNLFRAVAFTYSTLVPYDDIPRMGVVTIPDEVKDSLIAKSQLYTLDTPPMLWQLRSAFNRREIMDDKHFSREE
jgi:hypothetical protein